jgi:AraC-like DNA-binding protein
LSRKNFRPILHGRFVLIAALSGQVEMEIDGAKEQVRSGTLTLLASNTIHSFNTVKDRKIEWLISTFEMPKPAWSHQSVKQINLSSKLKKHLLEMMTHYSHASAESKMMLSLSLGRVLSHFEVGESEVPQPRSSKSSTLIMAVTSFLDSEPEASITTSRVLARFSPSSPSFRAQFRKAAGVSLGAFIREWKMNRAASYLTRGEWSISEVAEKTGWKSVYAFSRAFKARWKKPPSYFSKQKGLKI